MSLEYINLKLKEGVQLSNTFGIITKITATTIEITGLRPSIGDIVRIVAKDKSKNGLGMVTQIKTDGAYISPFGFVEGFRIGDFVYESDQGMNIPVGPNLLGRVVDPFMKPIDGKGAIDTTEYMPIMRAPIDAMKRGLINEPFSVGIKTIDGLLTCGKGQKLGIFAGSGVGKSTLMGMIVKNTLAPIKVVALIGERGREVPEFIEKNLGGDLEGTVIIVATSDDSSLMRKYGAFCAMSVAEYFKQQGNDVLFIMDSVTRFAMAQREIGLALGEPPTSKGYPPSSLTLLPQLMERAGKEEGKGSITAFFTVLVEGDDMSDPIADQSRSILDGHIVLSRRIAAQNHFPAIDVLSSVSRVMYEVVAKNHLEAAQEMRQLMAVYQEAEDLIHIGAYVKGSSPKIDAAIQKIDGINDFLCQGIYEVTSYAETEQQLIGLTGKETSANEAAS